MKLRHKLYFTLIAVAVGSALSVSAVFLELQKSAIEKSEAEKIDLILNETRNVISESLLAKDPLMIMDHLKTISRDRPEVVSTRMRISGQWRDISIPSSQKDAAQTYDREIWVENTGVSLRLSGSYINKQKKNALLNAAKDLVVALAVVCVLSIAAAFLLSWSLTRRLGSLSDEIRKVGEGKLGAVTRIKGSDEIADLAKKFNDMSQKLLELEQMKRTFISSVTHELRSPLGAIESYVRMLTLDESKWTASELANLGRIQENAARLSRFVTTLLDISRIEKGKMDLSLRLYNPATLVQDTVAFFAPKAKETGLDLKSEVQENIPVTLLDPDLIGHVVTNLLSNAIKFTPRNGRIMVSARTKAEGKNTSLRISVEDTGVGIPASESTRLFSPFERVKNPLNAKGTGLGLALAKGIVELHGGKIGVVSKIGKGSIFWFELPLKHKKGNL